jgi:leucyl aminopeptidase
VEIEFVNSPIEALNADVVAVGVSKDVDTDLAPLKALFGETISTWATENKFKGAVGSVIKFPTFGKMQSDVLLLVGTGDGSTSALQKAAGYAGREARKFGASTLSLSLDGLDRTNVQSIAELAFAGNYAFDRFKKESNRRSALTKLVITGSSITDCPNASTRAKWQNVARDLVNLPPANLYPETLADAAKELEELDHVEVEVWDFDRCRQEGCVGIVAVGQGSSRPGCLIHIKYNPPGAQGHVALVGKGVTFDSGGLSLKPSGSMQTMRCDMAGAATVLGAAGAIAEIGTPIRVDTFIGAVENMAGANSYKLGDILKYNNGVTVEIHNTDAEGRLVLADCLIQASKLDGVTHILDAATLTGAVVVAIGDDFTGVFTDDDALYGDLAQCAELEGEGVWRLPLHKAYKKSLKSEWADIKNVGGRAAGATTAALFLQHFVDEGITWAHLDVAGAAFHDKASDIYAPGGTGQMVRTLTSWAKHRAENA